jgi:hypothetical protein
LGGSNQVQPRGGNTTKNHLKRNAQEEFSINMENMNRFTPTASGEKNMGKIMMLIVVACFTATLTFVGPAEAVPVAPTLTAYFPLDDPSGSSTAANAVPGGNTGMLNSGLNVNTVWSADTPAALPHSTGSIHLPGTAGTPLLGIDISGTSPTQYVNSAQAFTYSTWFRLDSGALDAVSTSFPSLISLSSDLVPWRAFIGDRTGYEGINIGGSSGWVPLHNNLTGLDDDQWHQLIVTYNGAGAGTAGNFAMLLDGTPQTLTASSNYATIPGDQIGTDVAYPGNNQNFRGNLDDVVLFGEMLNSEQLQYLIAGGSPLFSAQVPEPGSCVLLSLGLFGLVRRTRHVEAEFSQHRSVDRCLDRRRAS